MGLGLSFAEGEGPRFERPVRDEAAVARLAVPDMDKLRYVFDAVASIRRALARPGAADRLLRQPVDARLLHGRRRAARDDYRLVKTMLYARPDLMHRILGDQRRRRGRLPERADRRRRAGGDGLRQLGRRARRRRLPALQPRLHASACCSSSSATHDGRRVPQIVFTKGGGPWLEAIAALGADVVGVDWTVDLGAARRRARRRASRCRATSIRTCCSPARRRSAREVATLLASFARGRRRPRNGHVFNLGHGISQHTPPEHVAVLVDAVHTLSPSIPRRRRA